MSKEEYTALVLAGSRSGALVKLHTATTTRSVSKQIERRIFAGGIAYRRYRHPEGLHSAALISHAFALA